MENYLESTRGDEVGDIGFWKEADGDLVSPLEIVE